MTISIVVVAAVGILSVRKCHWGLRRMRATQSSQDHNSSEREEREIKRLGEVTGGVGQ